MKKLPRLHHVWLATAFIGTSALSLTTYSERVLVPQGFAPAGLGIVEGAGAPSLHHPLAPRKAQLEGSKLVEVQPGAAPESAKAGAHRLIAKEPTENQAPSAEPSPAGLAAAGVDPAERELHRLLTTGSGPVLPSAIAEGKSGSDGAPPALLRPTAIQPTVAPAPGAADVTAAVPEPSTWLMFLLGLGVLGHALRAGRREFGGNGNALGAAGGR